MMWVLMTLFWLWLTYASFSVVVVDWKEMRGSMKLVHKWPQYDRYMKLSEKYDRDRKSFRVSFSGFVATFIVLSFFVVHTLGGI